MKWSEHKLYGGWRLRTRRRRSPFVTRRVEWELLYPTTRQVIARGRSESRWGAERDAMRARPRVTRQARP